MASKLGSVDPSRFPDESFDLYSIPAYDAEIPDIALGSGIGSTKQIVAPNDVLLSKIVPHIRRTWIVGEERGRRLIASGEWIVFRSDKVVPEYLRHLLRGDAFHAQFMKTVSGVGGSLLRARPAQVAQIQISLPSLAEQRRVAAILDKADALRAKRREALIYIDALTQSMFLEMFGEPIQNQRNWPIAKLAEVGRLDRGVSKHRPRNAPDLLGGIYPLIQTGDVANSDGYIRTYAYTYSELGLKQSKLWPKGTLCITIAANIAKTGIIEFDACFPDSVVGFSADDVGTIEYVRVWLSFLQKRLEELAPESAQKNINLAVLRNLDIPLPPLEKRSEFLLVIRKHESVRTNLRNSLTRVDQLFASLQHRAFTGAL